MWISGSAENENLSMTLRNNKNEILKFVIKCTIMFNTTTPAIEKRGLYKNSVQTKSTMQ